MQQFAKRALKLTLYSAFSFGIFVVGFLTADHGSTTEHAGMGLYVPTAPVAHADAPGGGDFGDVSGDYPGGDGDTGDCGGEGEGECGM